MPGKLLPLNNFKEYKPKTIADAFDGKQIPLMVNYQSMDILKTLDHICVI